MLAAATLALALLQAPGQGVSIPELLDRLGVESVEALVDAFPLASPAEDRLLTQLEDELLARGDLGAAEAVCRERLRARTERFGEGHRNTHPVLSNLAWILFRAGHFEEARARYEQLLELSIETSGSESLEVIVTRINLASVYQGLGEYGEVERTYAETLEAIRSAYGEASGELITVQTNAAVFLMEAGRLGEAEASAREALELVREVYGPESLDYAHARQFLAQVHESQWRLDEAEAGFRESKALFEAAVEGEDQRLGVAWRYLGSVLFSKGDYAGAESCWTTALRHLRATVGEAHFTTSAVYNGLGLAAEYTGELERATELMERSLEISNELFGRGHPGYVNVELNLANVWLERGEPERAEAICREALERLDQGIAEAPAVDHPNHLIKLSALGRLGQAQHALGRHEEALETVEGAIAGFESRYGPDHRQTLALRILEASILESLGRAEAAIEAAEAALRAAELMRPRILGDELGRARFADNLGFGAITSKLARLAILAGDPSDALEAAERGRGRFLLDLIARGEHRLFDARPDQRAAYERLVREEESARFELRQAEQRLSRASTPDRKEVIAATQALQKRSAAISAFLEQALVDARPMSADAIRAELSADELLVSFHWSSRLVALVLVPPTAAGGDEDPPVRALVVAEGPAACEALAQRVHGLARHLGTDPRARDGDAGTEALNELAATLFPAEVHGQLGAAKRVVVVAEGPLRSLPAGLLTSALGLEPEVAQAPSASVYLDRRALAGSRSEGDRQSSLLVVADPSFAPPAEAGEARMGWLSGTLAPLPATRAEAARAAELFEAAGRETRVLSGTDATRDALEREALEAAFLHFATHGLHGSGRQPMDAGLALSSGEGIAREQSFLTLDRLVRWWSGRLDGCELVLLSACDTHREIDAGADTLSLPWGFFHAGAPTVIATLWKVDDRAAALLVARFYENLLVGRADAAPMTKLAALTEAQAWLASATRSEIRTAWRALGEAEGAGPRGPGEAEANDEAQPNVDPAQLRPYADPYFWGSFVLLGAPD